MPLSEESAQGRETHASGRADLEVETVGPFVGTTAVLQPLACRPEIYLVVQRNYCLVVQRNFSCLLQEFVASCIVNRAKGFFEQSIYLGIAVSTRVQSTVSLIFVGSRDE